MPDSPKDIARLSNLRKTNSHYCECHARPMAAGAGSERGIGPAFRTPSSSTSPLAPSHSANLAPVGLLSKLNNGRLDGPRDERRGWCPRWMSHPLPLGIQLVCLAAVAPFLLSAVARDDSSSELANLNLFSIVMKLVFWCLQNPNNLAAAVQGA